MTAPSQDLELAFREFMKFSARLSDSYADLGDKVVALNAQIEQQGTAHSAPAAAQARIANRLECILDTLPAGVLVIDGEGCVQQCNPAAIELLGLPLLGEVWRHIIERAFAPRLDDGHDISLRDGRIVNISTNPLGSEPGQIVLVTDVTNTRRLQQRFNLQQRLLSMGEMAATLAHQIRTPLASALLYTSQLKNRRLEVPARERLVEKTLSRLRHLENLISNILIFARGGGVGDERFTTDALLGDLRQTLETYGEEGELCFTCRNEAPGVVLSGSRELLASALQNLATNAIQAMQGHGALHMVVRTAGGEGVELIVQDEGPGIAPEVMRQLFDPFFTTRSRGTGLGLAVVRAIARAHQGEVRVESRLGEGSAFIISLPLRDAQAQVERTVDAAMGYAG